MEYLGIIIAVVGSVVALIGVVISMMYWARSEANSLRGDAKEDRKDLINLVRAIELEMKDFHQKLYKLEEAKKEEARY